jgi:hypothetical protein
MEFEGLVQGMAQWQPVVGGGGSGEGPPAIPGGVFTVVSSVGKGYLLSGQIPLTEAGVMPFVPTSEFDIAKGVGLTLGVDDLLPEQGHRSVSDARARRNSLPVWRAGAET